ncbi:MAG: rhamnan synthesis F family protein [Rickettsiales bacterium]|nr:rhamnan synthesis F family protein [Rickettsiales bacterium]
MEYKKFITRNIAIQNKSANYNRLCVFSHFDRDSKIDDYVLHYLKALKSADCDIIFVSNCPNIDDSEIAKIENLAHRIILRKNEGYDFACYLTGFYEETEKEKYKQIIFANDSVYGPFYNLNKVFNAMQPKNLDMWGISDNVASVYHIQSYFLSFSTKMLKFLDNHFRAFKFENDKENIVTNNEVNLSRKALEQGFSLGAFCPHADVLAFESTNFDEKYIAKIKKNISENLFYKGGIKKFFSKKLNREINFRKYFDTYLTPHLSSWYSQIQYFNAPFIKTSLLKDPRLVHYHSFLYREVIKNKYPEFDLALIENHLNRVRNLSL